MSKSLNLVILIGTLGRDPEQRAEEVASLSVATTELDRNKQEHTEWHNVVAFKQTAKFAYTYLKKGSLVLIRGALRTRKYTANDGSERRVTEVVAFDIQDLLGKRSSENNENRTEAYNTTKKSYQGNATRFVEDEDIPL